MSAAMEPQMALPPDVSRGATINIVQWVGLGVSTFFVALRIYARARITYNLGWDDVLIVFAVILNITSTILLSVAISYGVGRHIQYLSPHQVTKTLYFSAIAEPIGIAAFCLPKLAVAIFIAKVMGPMRTGVYFLYGIIAVLYVISILCFIFIFAQCDPPSHFWNPESPAKCMSPNVLRDITYLLGAWSAFTDLTLALFPISIFWNLKIKTTRKVALSIIMGLGVMAMIAGIIKTTTLHQEEELDFTYNFYSLAISTIVEIDVVIICSCAPALPRLVLRLLGRDKQDRYGTPSAYKASGYRGYHPFSRHKDSALDSVPKESGQNSITVQSLPDNLEITRTINVDVESQKADRYA